MHCGIAGLLSHEITMLCIIIVGMSQSVQLKSIYISICQCNNR